MSLTLEIPAEVENELRAKIQTAQQSEEAQRIAKSDAALDELTRITEGLGLYEESDFSPSQEAELVRRLEAYRNDGDTGTLGRK